MVFALSYKMAVVASALESTKEATCRNWWSGNWSRGGSAAGERGSDADAAAHGDGERGRIAARAG